MVKQNSIFVNIIYLQLFYVDVEFTGKDTLWRVLWIALLKILCHVRFRRP